MATLFHTLAISFLVIILFAFFLNFCRRRLRNTPHGLTGMCHKNGGTMCSSCQEATRNNTTSS